MDPAEVLMREAEALVAQQFRDCTIAQIAAAIERELRAGGPPFCLAAKRPPGVSGGPWAPSCSKRVKRSSARPTC